MRAGKAKFGGKHETPNSSQSRRKEDTNLCVICWDRERGPYACVPCGHQCLCTHCKDLIIPHKSRCPYCNVPLQMIMKLFRPA